MPYVLLEAAAAGLPIVATDVVEEEASNIPNIHFVPPQSGQALADAVEKLAQNLPGGKPCAIGSFADMLKKTVELYDSGSQTARNFRLPETSHFTETEILCAEAPVPKPELIPRL